jgi:hypothetical protein
MSSSSTKNNVHQNDNSITLSQAVAYLSRIYEIIDQQGLVPLRQLHEPDIELIVDDLDNNREEDPDINFAVTRIVGRSFYIREKIIEVRQKNAKKRSQFIKQRIFWDGRWNPEFTIKKRSNEERRAFAERQQKGRERLMHNGLVLHGTIELFLKQPETFLFEMFSVLNERMTRRYESSIYFKMRGLEHDVQQVKEAFSSYTVKSARERLKKVENVLDSIKEDIRQVPMTKVPDLFKDAVRLTQSKVNTSDLQYKKIFNNISVAIDSVAKINWDMPKTEKDSSVKTDTSLAYMDALLSQEFLQFFQLIKEEFINGSYEVVEVEKKLIDKEIGLCGYADMICRKTNSPANEVEIWDWKNAEQVYYNGQENAHARAPLEQLKNCNYDEWCMQLNLYKYLLEKWYNFKVVAMKVVRFHVTCGNSCAVVNIKDLPELTNILIERTKFKKSQMSIKKRHISNGIIDLTQEEENQEKKKKK